jgi:hypothetical protein
MKNETATRRGAPGLARVSAALLAMIFVAASCGDSTEDDSTAEESAAEESTSEESGAQDAGGDPMDDMEAMNMGDVTATRADEIAGAAVAVGEFTLLDTRPPDYDETAGTAWISRHVAGTTVTVEIAGLEPNTDYISHVHADRCANNGGAHYQFEVDGATVPPNEIHLAFTSDANGTGFMTAENHQIAGLEAVALVVHPQLLLDNKIACVEFAETMPGAAAAAIVAGTDHDLDDMDEMEDTDG